MAAHWTALCLALVLAGAVSADNAPRSHAGGRVESRQTFLYGKFEATVRGARGGGLVTSFALARPGASDFASISIARIFGQEANQYHTELVFSSDNKVESVPSVVKPHESFDAFAVHTYGVEWSPSKVEFFVDGRRVSLMDGTHKLAEAQAVVFDLWAVDKSQGFAGCVKRAEDGRPRAVFDSFRYWPYDQNTGAFADFPAVSDDFGFFNKEHWHTLDGVSRPHSSSTDLAQTVLVDKKALELRFVAIHDASNPSLSPDGPRAVSKDSFFQDVHANWIADHGCTQIQPRGAECDTTHSQVVPQLNQDDIPLEPHRLYMIGFKAQASKPVNVHLGIQLGKGNKGYVEIGGGPFVASIGPKLSSFHLPFVAPAGANHEQQYMARLYANLSDGANVVKIKSLYVWPAVQAYQTNALPECATTPVFLEKKVAIQRRVGAASCLGMGVGCVPEEEADSAADNAIEDAVREILTNPSPAQQDDMDIVYPKIIPRHEIGDGDDADVDDNGSADNGTAIAVAATNGTDVTATNSTDVTLEGVDLGLGANATEDCDDEDEGMVIPEQVVLPVTNGSAPEAFNSEQSLNHINIQATTGANPNFNPSTNFDPSANPNYQQTQPQDASHLQSAPVVDQSQAQVNQVQGQVQGQVEGQQAVDQSANAQGQAVAVDQSQVQGASVAQGGTVDQSQVQAVAQGGQVPVDQTQVQGQLQGAAESQPLQQQQVQQQQVQQQQPLDQSQMQQQIDPNAQIQQHIDPNAQTQVAQDQSAQLQAPALVENTIPDAAGQEVLPIPAQEENQQEMAQYDANANQAMQPQGYDANQAMQPQGFDANQAMQPQGPYDPSAEQVSAPQGYDMSVQQQQVDPQSYDPQQEQMMQVGQAQIDGSYQQPMQGAMQPSMLEKNGVRVGGNKFRALASKVKLQGRK